MAGVVTKRRGTKAYRGKILYDKDGNAYNIIIINNQEWTVGNFRSTKYANGNSIANITDNTAWVNDGTGAYCWYDNDIANKTEYGALYNWHAVNNANGFAYLEDINQVQETGWRVPTTTDFATFSTFLGGDSYAGDKLKEAGNAHWAVGTDGTNEFGFTSLPSGRRNGGTGLFEDRTPPYNQYEHFWSSVESSPTGASARRISNGDEFYPLNLAKVLGISVRLVRDL